MKGDIIKSQILKKETQKSGYLYHHQIISQKSISLMIQFDLYDDETTKSN